MSSSTRVLAALGAAVAVSLVTVAFLTGADAPAAAPVPAPASAPQPANDLALQRLHGEVARLRGAVTTMERAPAPTPEAAPELSDEEREQAFRDRAARTALGLDRALHEEGRDPAWSATAERQLRDGFGQAPVAGAHLDETYCASTLCRIRVRFDSLALRDDGIDDVMRLVDWDSELIARADPADRRNFVIYASRAPSLPAVE
jgi:hypothetical protein